MTTGYKIKSLIASVPANIKRFDPDDAKMARLAKTVGIFEKRVCSENQTFNDISEIGAREAIKRAGINAVDIDAIIVLTQSPDYIVPGNAVSLQYRLGLRNNIIAFDINLGCSGMPFILHLAGCYISAGMHNVLIVFGDQSFNPTTSDLGAAWLFGDASVSCVVSSGKNSLDSFSFGVDGSGIKSLYVPEGGKRKPLSSESLVIKDVGGGIRRSGVDVVLNGPEILHFSLKRIPPFIEQFTKLLGRDLHSIDKLYFHQANLQINKSLNKVLGVDFDQSPISLEKFGNTSSASPGLTFADDVIKNGIPRSCIWCGFGIGLSWGAAYYTFEGDEIVDLIDV